MNADDSENCVDADPLQFLQQVIRYCDLLGHSDKLFRPYGAGSPVII